MAGSARVGATTYQNYHFARHPFETNYLPGQFELGILILLRYDNLDHLEQVIHSVPGPLWKLDLGR